MSNRNTIKISVRNLVEFILRSGDLNSTFTGSSRNTDAIKAHQKIQKSAPKEYAAEVSLSYTFEKEDISLEISGRADGIIDNDGVITIDEIKTTTAPIEFINEDYNLIHWAQAKTYAFIYAKENVLENIYVQLTYYQIDTKEIKRFIKSFSFKELEEFFLQIANSYIEWAKTLSRWGNYRDDSIKSLEFPFENYREGQRKLAVAVYKTISEGKKIFIQAPTGIGKTVATLFPSLKAMGEGHTSKIFYLTAKTITRTAGEKALNNLREKGLKIKSLTITAKDKICFKPDASCNPEECHFAKGYFDRINEAVKDIYLNEENFSREILEKYGKKYDICPFEFSLELSLFSDCIICDYNYVFDPRVYLRRFFLEGTTDFTFLIDEAHNLVDRAREMFSAEINKEEILNLKKLSMNYSKDISKTLNKLNSHMIEIRKLCEANDKEHIQEEAPMEITYLLMELMPKAEKWLLENKDKNNEFKEKLLDFYFKALAFIRTNEYYDENFVTYGEKQNNSLKLKLFCLDPSHLLKEASKRGKSTVFFSATLLPMDYFIDILGGESQSYKLRLSSPFSRDNLCLTIDSNISTTYKMREFTYDKILEDLNAVINTKAGNYLVFFPSHKYMREVLDRFSQRNPDIKTIYQETSMNEEERECFLENFREGNKDTLVGFAVMGGLFSEGIDLVGDRLIGTIIVGVGLPQICLERNIINDYFKKKNNQGFEYAYMYPGMNKVMQAAGRVIRREEDKGIVLLIDERFIHRKYYKLFPKEWNNPRICKNSNELGITIGGFWENIE